MCVREGERERERERERELSASLRLPVIISILSTNQEGPRFNLEYVFIIDLNTTSNMLQYLTTSYDPYTHVCLVII